MRIKRIKRIQRNILPHIDVYVEVVEDKID